MRGFRRQSRLAGLALACAGAVSLVLSGNAFADMTINVETTADVSVNNDNECSLREALTSANTNSGGTSGCESGVPGPARDFIELPAGTYPLLGAAGDDANLNGDLDYIGGGGVVIQGPFSPTGVLQATIDAPPSDRIVDVPAPTVPSRSLFLNLVALTDGRALGALAEGDGGAVRIAVPNVNVDLTGVTITGSQAGRNGGALSFDASDAFGNLQIFGSEFSGNAAGTQVIGGSGGAIWSGVDQASNSPIVSASTLAGNSATGVGGAYALKSSATASGITFRNSTLSGNSSGTGGNAVGYSGAGAYPSVSFEFSTIAANTSTASHAGIETADAGQQVFLRGSIISGNTGAGAALNCGGPGTFTSQTYNVESANTCGLVPVLPDLINTDPLLAPLAINAVGGGLTPRTRGLYDGSPAADFIPRTAPDKCDDMFTDGTDERGVVRPSAPNGRCDAGAFEGTVGPKPVLPSLTNPTPVPTSKKCKKGQKRKVVKGKVKCVKKKRKRGGK